MHSIQVAGKGALASGKCVTQKGLFTIAQNSPRCSKTSAHSKVLTTYPFARACMQQAKDVHVQTMGQHVFPGDVLTHVDGSPADKMSQAVLRQYLAQARPEIEITIAPLSPLRRKRPSSTRLHETFLSDDTVKEPSSMADDIND